MPFFKLLVCALVGIAVVPGLAAPGQARAAAPGPLINAHVIPNGVGDPWGTAIDRSGNVWFAEPGCDFTPTCPAETPPGQIGELDRSSGRFRQYRLPDIPGNQPIFLAFDRSGNLWFTTPNNSMIGEFRPWTRRFAGQWPVTAGSGPWDLTFANGRLWYTENLVSAVGSFDPVTHAHQDFQTPTPGSHPYGIAARGRRIWFTENPTSVDQVAVLDTANGNSISEYPIVEPKDGTPHKIVVDRRGHPWWTEGWSNTIATLDPAVATPGSCGSSSGTCIGVRRFTPPPSTTCGSGTHASGIAYERNANRIWLDNSLTGQVGSFTPSTGMFEMTALSDCGHPHDGLSVDSAGHVWFDEEFANTIGELIPPDAAAAAHRLTSELSKLLSTSTRRRAIAKLRSNGGFACRFAPPAAGTLRISWQARPGRVASAHAHYRKAGAAKVAIKLTATGRRVLRQAGRLRLVAEATFTRAGQPKVTRLKEFTLVSRAP
jgi:streptogramin lyase